MKNKFGGMQSVFAFTFRQVTKGKGFKIATALISLVIIGIFILINVFIAKPDSSEDITIEASLIETVYVLDKSGLQATDYKELNPEFSEDHLNHIEFINVTDISEEEVVQLAENNPTRSIAMIISASKGDYQIDARIPEVSEISSYQAWDLAIPMAEAFETNKMLQAGLSMEQLQAILKPTYSTFNDIGDSTSDFTLLIRIFAPMIFSFTLYFMLILYGQNVGKAVAAEKTSKLVETLLVSVRPYGLIAGKVLATTTVAILQFTTWILAGFLGLYGGNAIAQYFYPGHENTAIMIIDFVKDNIGETGMTLPAVILAIIMFCIGFLFYCTLSGLSGSFSSKAEDIAQTQGLFQLPIVISWLFAYFAPMSGNERLASVLRYIPFTAPFSVPVDLITGTIGLADGFISLAIMFVFTLLVIFLSGRIYKGLILYTGQKISFKTVRNVLKADS